MVVPPSASGGAPPRPNRRRFQQRQPEKTFGETHRRTDRTPSTEPITSTPVRREPGSEPAGFQAEALQQGADVFSGFEVSMLRVPCGTLLYSRQARPRAGCSSRRPPLLLFIILTAREKLLPPQDDAWQSKQRCTSLLIEDVVFGDGVVVSPFTNLYACTIGDARGSARSSRSSATPGRCDRCKIPSHSFICPRRPIEDEVFVGHGVTFMNDKFPRAKPTASRRARRLGAPPTTVDHDASSARAPLSWEGSESAAPPRAGAVVTRDVDAEQVVAGNPARLLFVALETGAFRASPGRRSDGCSVFFFMGCLPTLPAAFQLLGVQYSGHAGRRWRGSPGDRTSSRGWPSRHGSIPA